MLSAKVAAALALRLRLPFLLGVAPGVAAAAAGLVRWWG